MPNDYGAGWRSAVNRCIKCVCRRCRAEQEAVFVVEFDQWYHCAGPTADAVYCQADEIRKMSEREGHCPPTWSQKRVSLESDIPEVIVERGLLNSDDYISIVALVCEADSARGRHYTTVADARRLVESGAVFYRSTKIENTDTDVHVLDGDVLEIGKDYKVRLKKE